MKITVRKVWGKVGPCAELQARGNVNGEPRAYNVQLFLGCALAIPRLIMIRRSSWAGRDGDSQSLPF